MVDVPRRRRRRPKRFSVVQISHHHTHHGTNNGKDWGMHSYLKQQQPASLTLEPSLSPTLTLSPPPQHKLACLHAPAHFNSHTLEHVQIPYLHEVSCEGNGSRNLKHWQDSEGMNGSETTRPAWHSLELSIADVDEDDDIMNSSSKVLNLNGPDTGGRPDTGGGLVLVEACPRCSDDWNAFILPFQQLTWL